MPRKMPFRRPRRRPGGQRRMPPRLRQAHRLLERGKHRQAAVLFEELASRAEDIHILRAPLLYLQAGRAYLLGNEVETGRQQLFKAIDLAIAQGDSNRLAMVGRRLDKELKQLGYRELAAEIATRLAEAGAAEEEPAAAPEARSLPGKCKQCGATLHPDEIEALSQNSYACAYCGSRVMVGAD